MKQFYYITLLIIFQLLIVNTDTAKAGIFNRKVDSIKLVIDKNQLVLPGESFEIGVVSYHKNGRVKKTIGMNSGSCVVVALPSRNCWWNFY